MKVHELISILQSMPPDAEVEVNDNGGGEVFSIDQVDHFVESETGEGDPEVVVIQVNC